MTGPVPSAAGPRRTSRTGGIGWHLGLAFTAVTSLILVSCLLAWTSYDRVEAILHRVSADTLPGFSRLSTLAHAANRLSTVAFEVATSDAAEHRSDGFWRLIAVEDRFRTALRALEDQLDGTGPENADALLPLGDARFLVDTGRQITANLRTLASTMQGLASIRVRREERLAELIALGDRVGEGVHDPAAEDAAAAGASDAARRAADRIDAVVHLLLSAQSMPATAARALESRAAAALDALDAHTGIDGSDAGAGQDRSADAALPPAVGAAVLQLRTLVTGRSGLFQLRRRQERGTEQLLRLLDTLRDRTEALTGRIDAMTTASTQKVEADVASLGRTIDRSRFWLVGFSLAGIALSLLIAWFYVRGRVVRRLTALSEIMLAIAQNDHERAVPTDGRDEIADMARSLVVFRDNAKALQKAQRKLRKLATRDRLTGLPNRALVMETFQAALAKAERRNGLVAGLYLDLDRFKHINDSLGHTVGDALIRLVGERIKACLRVGDTIGRLGGDEFFVVLDDIEDTNDVIAVANRIRDAVQQPAMVGEARLHSSISIGIALYPDDGSDAETLFSRADLAMYAAKAIGPGQWRFVSREMTERASARLQMEADLREAVRNRELEVHFQPKVSTQDRRIIGAEALLRWQRAGEPIPPTVFVEIAEDIGLIDEIGLWVIEESCRHLRHWTEMAGPLQVSVNVSPRQLADERFLATVSDILVRTGMRGEQLEFELTESSLMTVDDQRQGLLEGLRRLGIGLAVDDFGTGYSNLGYIRDLPIDVLKIDRSFVEDLPGEHRIALTILALARGMNLKTVAEGVETAAQFNWLASAGCDAVQGFLIARPMPPEAFTRLLETSAPAASDRGGLRAIA